MDAQAEDLAVLRSRVAALVEQESGLLQKAFELNRANGDRRAVDALFAEVQLIQVQRSGLKKRIEHVLGRQRLHTAAEVHAPGVYDYRSSESADVLRVRVTADTLGFKVALPGRANPLRLDALKGIFEGPLGEG